PFSDHIHDEYLILDILNGLRPELINNLPQPYIDLMEKCWDANPLNRPNAADIITSIGSIESKLAGKVIKFPENVIHRPIKEVNPQAIYTSRSLSSLVNTALRMKLNYSTLT
ncbi:21448_t:CDS:1, partial [Racocetra persica]